MNSAFGLIGKNFALLVSDIIASKSLVNQKNNMDKIVEIGNKKMLIISGNSGDISNFVDFVQKTIQLYALKTGYSLSTHSVANFLKRELSQSFRKGALTINLIIAGYDELVGISLYYLDYTGNLQRMNHCVQGYASLFISSILNRNYNPLLKIEDAVILLLKCILVLKKRFIINHSNFIVKIIDKKGSRLLCSF
jgi:20S proteasome subunit beta 4